MKRGDLVYWKNPLTHPLPTLELCLLLFTSEMYAGSSKGIQISTIIHNGSIRKVLRANLSEIQS